MNKAILPTLFTALTFSFFAQAETINCTAITSLPYVITIQGAYCLTGPLNTSITSGHAITINTNNVQLDLNGFKLGGLSAGLGTQANGIYAFQRQNITIRNGTVRGFFVAINLDDLAPYTTSQGHVVAGISADQNTYRGFQVSGNGNTIQNSQVVGTGGSTVYGTNVEAMGMYVRGPGAQIFGNMITAVAAQGNAPAMGIFMDTASSAQVHNNRLSDLSSPTGSTIGILLGSGTGLLVRNNNLTGMQFGVNFSSSTGKYMQNLTHSVTIPYTGGTAAGTTNF